MKINEIKKLRLKHQVMALPCDLKVTNKIVSMLPNTTLLEFGTGSGGWPHVNTLIGAHFQNCYLVDNFSWVEETLAKDIPQDSVNKWIRNKDELQTYLQQEINTEVTVIKLDTVIDNVVSELEKTIAKKIGILRIDCLIHDDILLEVIDKFLDPELGVIFVDDIKLNGGFDRIQKIFYLLKEHDWHTLWFGEKECAIVKNLSLQTELFEKLSQQIFNDNELLVIKEKCEYGRFLSSRYHME